MGRRGLILTVRTTLALRGFVWVAASAKTPTWQRRSRRACFSYQARDGHRGGCCRHTMAVGVLVPPDATRVAACVATVYTNAPKPRREARSSHLCTLLRSQGHPQPKLASQQCTQMPQNGAERPFSPICVHSCVTTAARATGRGHRSIGIQTVLRGRGAPWCPSWPGPFSCPWRVEPLYRVHGSDDRAVCRTGAIRSGAFACLLVIEHGKRRG